MRTPRLFAPTTDQPRSVVKYRAANISISIPAIAVESGKPMQSIFASPTQPLLLERRFAGMNLEANQEAFQRCMMDRVTPTRDYYESYLDQKRFNSASRFHPYQLTIAEVLASWESGQKVQTIEGPVPETVRRLMSDHVNADLPAAQGVTAFFFGGYRGLVSEMHFDGDYCDVLIIQLMGRKRLEFNLNARFGDVKSIFNQSTIRRSRMDPHVALTEYTKELGPGDGLLFPGYLWHRAVYLNAGFSVTIRFGACRTSRFLGEYFHKDFNSRIVVEQLRRRSSTSFDLRRATRVLFDHAIRPAQKLTEMEQMFFETAETTESFAPIAPDHFRRVEGYAETAMAVLSKGLYTRLP